MQPGNPIGWRAGLVYGLLPVVLVVTLGARKLGAVASGQLLNPDSYARMVRLLDATLDPGSGHFLRRDSSGGGTLVHWSHLLDSVLTLIALPFSLVLDHPAALHVAAVVFGPLCLAGLGLAAAWAAAPFAEKSWLWLAPVLATFGHSILAYGLPGVVHHHVPATIVAIMTAGWAARLIAFGARPTAGRQLGAWAGIGIWLTPETLPLSMLAIGALWLSWATSPTRHDLAGAFRDAGVGLLVTVFLAFAVDPPYGGYAIEDIDRLSIVFVALSAAIAATGLVIAIIDEATDRPDSRVILSLGAGTVIAGIWLFLFPSVLQGSRHLMPDAEWQAMFSDIAEMQPVKTVAQWLQYLLTGCLASLALAVLAWRARSLVLAYTAVGGIATVVMGWMHLRFACYPQALGAVMLPVIVTVWNRHTAHWPATRQSLPRIATIMLFLLVPFASEMPQPFKTAQAGKPAAADCGAAGLSTMLSPAVGQVVLTNVNDTPELLYTTGIRTVGSLYHRNVSGFMRLRAAWRAQDLDSLPEAFRAADIGFVLFCPAKERSALVRGLPQGTMWDRLQASDPPGWLHLLTRDAMSGQVLYRVGS